MPVQGWLCAERRRLSESCKMTNPYVVHVNELLALDIDCCLGGSLDSANLLIRKATTQGMVSIATPLFGKYGQYLFSTSSSRQPPWPSRSGAALLPGSTPCQIRNKWLGVEDLLDSLIALPGA